MLSLTACGEKPQPTEAPVTTVVSETTAASEATASVPSETGEKENKDIFTGSVNQKGVPDMETLIILDKADDIIDLESGRDKVVCEVPAEKLSAIALSRRDEAGEAVKAALEKAYQDIVSAESLLELCEDGKAAVEASQMDAEKLVVRDLFDLELDQEYGKVLDEEQNYMALTFKLGLQEGEKLFVLHCDDEGEWEAIYGENLVIHEDGSVTVAFESLSPVAIVVEG